MYQISSVCALCILYMKMNWQRERIGVKIPKKKKKTAWGRNNQLEPTHRSACAHDQKDEFQHWWHRKTGRGNVIISTLGKKKVLTKAGPWVALCASGGSQALGFDAAVNKHVLASQIVLVLSTSVLGRRPSSPQGPSGAT